MEELAGRIERIEGLLNGTYRISLVTPSEPHIQGFEGKDIYFSVREKKRGRSLDANAYYWCLVGRLADVLHASKPYIHNLMLRRYGQLLIYEGRAVYVVIPETEDATKRVDEDTTLHLLPTSQVKEGKGGMFRTYMLLKGSHEYDSKEMWHLLQGLIDECKQVGIETMTPNEIERMMQTYEAKKQTKSGV